MKTGKILLSFCISVVIVMTACSKGGVALTEDEQHVQQDFTDTTFPVIEILKPSNNQSFTSGDIIKVQGKVTDNGLYQGSIRIKDDANGAVAKEQSYEIHFYQSYDFSIEYKATVTSATNYTITVQFEDHGSNITSKSVKVKVNP